MREFFTIAIFKIKADIRMNKTTLNSQKEKHSILSLRRATQGKCILVFFLVHFYSRSPCGERQPQPGVINWNFEISIHALLAESDPGQAALVHGGGISIHALLAESDAVQHWLR